MTGLLAGAGCSDGPAFEVGPKGPELEEGKGDGASSGKAELKVTITPDHIRRARSRLGLLNADSQTRRIWFYDTTSLALYEAGTILRAREIDGDDDDSTVKLRPFELSQLSAEFAANDDMKCEIDRLTNSATSACSLKIDQEDGEIAEVGNGEREIDKLFSSEQEAFFAAYGPDVAWDQLQVLGPISARVWEISSAALPEDVDVELWYMPDGSQVLELSMKVAEADGNDAMAALLDFVDDKGLGLANEQESKTRRALETLAGPTQRP